MKILVGFTSKYGAAGGAAEEIAQALNDAGHQTQIFDLAKSPGPKAEDWDGFVLGGSIYAGQMSRKLRGWIENHEETLAQKPLGLFVTSLATGEKALAYLESSYPPALLAHASAKGVTGGIANFEKMGWLDKVLLRKVAKIHHTKDTRDPGALKAFIDSYLTAVA